jgi:hypothetical protein
LWNSQLYCIMSSREIAVPSNNPVCVLLCTVQCVCGCAQLNVCVCGCAQFSVCVCVWLCTIHCFTSSYYCKRAAFPRLEDFLTSLRADVTVLSLTNSHYCIAGYHGTLQQPCTRVCAQPGVQQVHGKLHDACDIRQHDRHVHRKCVSCDL